jgi:acetyl-CoA synthetase
MPKTILKYSCTSFYSKRPKYRGLYLFRFENQSSKFTILKSKHKTIGGATFLFRYIILYDAWPHIYRKVLSFPSWWVVSPIWFCTQKQILKMLLLIHFTSGTTNAKRCTCASCGFFTHYITGKIRPWFHEGDRFCVLPIPWNNWYHGIHSPLVSGVTSIIDEAKFDANRWYSILEEQK